MEKILFLDHFSLFALTLASGSTYMRVCVHARVCMYVFFVLGFGFGVSSNNSHCI